MADDLFKLMGPPEMSVAQARQILKEGRPVHSAAKIKASFSLMAACRTEPLQVKIDDAFICLSYGGTIGEVGARCLYVLTGRDGVGWGHGDTFVVDHADWDSYLRKHHPNSFTNG